MASTLPEDVWSLILQHVPVADRLGRCALVCKKLSRAAAAATDALNVSLRRRSLRAMLRQQQLEEAFASCLQHHGSHVTSLVLGNGYQALTQLPCPQLLHLEVSGASPVQLGPHGGLPGVLDSCTGLTCLKLSDCTVTPDGGLSRLAVLVDLRHLAVHSVQKQVGGRRVSLPGSVLPSLTHLTCLDLSRIGGVEDVHHVSSLTSLSVLSIRGVARSQSVRLAPSIAPDFVLPASLQHLCLGRGVMLDPAVLAAATQLTRVELERLSVEGPGGGVSSGAALLAAVAGLQQLESLELSRTRIDWPAPSAAYAALTASSKLQKLIFGGVPVGGWEHAFPPARCCPAMREFAAYEGVDADAGVGRWGAAAVSRLVSYCPGLQNLALLLSDAPAVAALKPLALTKLVTWIDCPLQSDVRVSAERCAVLQHLCSLELHLSIDDEDDGADAAASHAAALLPLTSLRPSAAFKLGQTWATKRRMTMRFPCVHGVRLTQGSLQMCGCRCWSSAWRPAAASLPSLPLLCSWPHSRQSSSSRLHSCGSRVWSRSSGMQRPWISRGSKLQR